MNTRSFFMLILVILIIANISFIWSRSLYSKNESATQSGEIVSNVTKMIPSLEKIPYEILDIAIRKLAHFAEFCSLGMLSALLTFLITDTAIDNFYRNCIFTALVTLSVASTDEMLQIFSNRGSRVTDVMIDFSGAVIGIAAVMLIIRSVIIKARKKSSAPTAN